MKSTKKMTDSELKSLVVQEAQQAVNYINEIVSPERQLSLKAYLGEPYGNERDGRSKFVARDCMESVLWILPQLLETFVASEDIVMAVPVNGSDTKVAEQVTALLNHVFYRENNGFMLLYNWFHDALVLKTGFVKSYYEKKVISTVERYPRISLDSFMLMQSQDNVEVVEFEFLDVPEGQQLDISQIDPQQAPFIYVSTKIIVKEDKGKICNENLPPEEVLIDRHAKTIEDARFVAHRTRKTASDLIEMGFSRATVEDLPSWNENTDDFQAEAYIRSPERSSNDASVDASMREIEIIEAYVRIDYDNDGIAELRKIVVAGNVSGISKILSNEEFDGSRPPIFELCFVPLPHRLFGHSIPDLTNDLQLLNTTVIRNVLDNFYITNNPDTAVDITRLRNPEVLATVTPGRVYLTSGPGAVMPVPQSPMSSAAFPLLEMISTWRESRTGVSRYSQGLDPSAINKTASGISQILDASRQRVKLYARIAAETGVPALFKFMLELTLKYQQTSKIIRLKESYVPVDPREWKTQFDVVINVGLGTGNKDQNLGHLMNIMQIQQQIMNSGGNGVLVSPETIYNAAAKVVENSGLRTPELFFLDPGQRPDKGNVPPPPDPKVQQEQQKMQLEMQKLQVHSQLEREKMMAEIQLQREKMMAEMQLKREQIQADMITQDNKSIRDMTAKVHKPNIPGGIS